MVERSFRIIFGFFDDFERFFTILTGFFFGFFGYFSGSFGDSSITFKDFELGLKIPKRIPKMGQKTLLGSFRDSFRDPPGTFEDS